MRAGCSQLIENIQDCSRYFEEARFACKMSCLLQDTNYITYYQNVCVFQMFESIKAVKSLHDFYPRELKALLDHDRKKGTNYYRTLYTYLSAMKDAALTAQKLMIHKNSLFYRLNKIEEFFGINLSDPDTVFHILLSFKLDAYLGKTNE